MSVEETRAKASGGATLAVVHFIRDRIGLAESDAVIVEQTSLACQQELSALDSRAEVVLTKLRASHPGGRLSQGEKPPAPAPELVALDQERKDVILRYRLVLQGRLGSAAFNTFDRYAGVVAGKMRRVSFGSARAKAGSSGDAPVVQR